METLILAWFVLTQTGSAFMVAALGALHFGGTLLSPFLGVLADQRIREGGSMVSFLGQRTRMTDAPARLALTADAPILPVGIRREAGSRHLATIFPPIQPVGGKDAVTTLTQSVADALGRLIQLAPEQWIWIHPRWEEAHERQIVSRRGGAGADDDAGSNRREKEELCVSP